MATAFPLTDYIERAMSYATYEVLEDGTVAGRIPQCLGVITFAETVEACHIELRSMLEEWMLLGFRLGDPLPVIDDLNLNLDPERDLVLASLDSLQAQELRSQAEQLLGREITLEEWTAL